MSDIPVKERGTRRKIEATEPEATEPEAAETEETPAEDSRTLSLDEARGDPSPDDEPEADPQEELPPGVQDIEVHLPTPGNPGNVHEIMIAQLQAINQLMVQLVNHMAAIRNYIHEKELKKG